MDVTRRVHGETTCVRLARITRLCDPSRLFRQNHNGAPERQGGDGRPMAQASASDELDHHSEQRDGQSAFAHCDDEPTLARVHQLGESQEQQHPQAHQRGPGHRVSIRESRVTREATSSRPNATMLNRARLAGRGGPTISSRTASRDATLAGGRPDDRVRLPQRGASCFAGPAQAPPRRPGHLGVARPPSASRSPEVLAAVDVEDRAGDETCLFISEPDHGLGDVGRGPGASSLARPRVKPNRADVEASNRSADEDVEAVLAVDGVLVEGSVTVRTLGADVRELFAVNTLPEPDVLGIRESSAVLDGGMFEAPAHSVSVVGWDVAAGCARSPSPASLSDSCLRRPLPPLQSQHPVRQKRSRPSEGPPRQDIGRLHHGQLHRLGADVRHCQDLVWSAARPPQCQHPVIEVDDLLSGERGERTLLATYARGGEIFLAEPHADPYAGWTRLRLESRRRGQ